MKTGANLLIVVALLLPLAAAVDNRRNQLKQWRSYRNDDGGRKTVARPQRQVRSWQSPPSSKHRVSHGSHLRTLLESTTTTTAVSTTTVKCGDVITTDTVISNGLTCNCATDKPALTVSMGATVDLNQMTISCETKVEPCIKITKGSKVMNGMLYMCRDGVKVVGSESEVTGLTVAYVKEAIVIDGDSNTISSNTIIGASGAAIQVNGDANVVQGNTMKHSEEGIVVSGDESWIENNVMERMADSGILVTGREAHVVNNTIHATSNGIRLKQSAWLGFIQGNKVTDAKNDGIYLRANNCTIMENMIINASHDGIHVEGDVVDMDSNNVTGSRESGISVLGDVMLRNKVKGSGDNGVEMEGPLNAAVLNEISDSAGDGITACGNDIEILNNTIKESMENGIRLGCDVGPVIYDVRAESLIRGNEITGSGSASIRLGAGTLNNVIRENTVAGNVVDESSECHSGICCNSYMANAIRGILSPAECTNQS